MAVTKTPDDDFIQRIKIEIELQADRTHQYEIELRKYMMLIE
jgi:hypothetical protein